MWEQCGNILTPQKEKTSIERIYWGFERCLAESNRCSRFCRPVPNRSAKAPFSFWDCKYKQLFRKSNSFWKNIEIYWLIICHLWSSAYIGRALSEPTGRVLAILAPVGAENMGLKGENETVTQSFGQKVAWRFIGTPFICRTKPFIQQNRPFVENPWYRYC